MRWFAISIPGLILVLVVAPVALTEAHPHHVTMAEVEHNPEAKTLEVALHVDAGDLEFLLGRRHGRTIDLDKTEGVDALISAYLAQMFTVRTHAGARQRLRWVGKEVDGQMAWLYFEILLPRPLKGGKATSSLQGMRLANRVFFDLQINQVNTVRFRDRERRRTFLFRRGDGEEAALDK